MSPKTRQAVVVVHGIGEQRPMTTLTGYVDSLKEEHDLAFAAPDRISDYRDQQRVKVTWHPRIVPGPNSPNSAVPTYTDFFELYWANLVQGSELRHVWNWLLSLLLRWPRLGDRLKRFLKFHAVWACLLLVLSAAIFIASFWLSGLSSSLEKVFQTGSAIAASAAGAWLVAHLADVPRYLHNVASNVSIQRMIRREGVSLLRKLHSATFKERKLPLYDRVIVIGHSLGSVVAYDIVRDYWAEAYDYYALSGTDDPDLLEAADRVDRIGEALWARGEEHLVVDKDPGFSDYQTAQRKLFSLLQNACSLPPGEPKSSMVRWAITDLVTLACPLTHSELLGKTLDEIEEAQWKRQLASCPPRRQMNRPSYRFVRASKLRGGKESWHQAAPFAITRWTNIFYESDVVGGPIQKIFGPGITDIQLTPPTGSSGRMPSVHSLYNKSPLPLAILRRIVWDGGTRRDDHAALVNLQRKSLESVLRELAGASDPSLELTWVAKLSRHPLLRRMPETAIKDLAKLLGTASARSNTGPAIEELVNSVPEQYLGYVFVLDEEEEPPDLLPRS